jgi:hypothetical protein
MCLLHMVKQDVRYTKARMCMIHTEARLYVHMNEREIGHKVLLDNANMSSEEI